ncbi:hypothetical protein WAI453_000607 [Rhynchosporium graminicola]
MKFILLSALLIPGALSRRCSCVRIMENDIAVTSRMPFGDGITTVTSPATNKQGQRVGYCAIGYNRSKNGKRLACADWYMVTNATGKVCDGKVGPVSCYTIV